MKIVNTAFAKQIRGEHRMSYDGAESVYQIDITILIEYLFWGLICPMRNTYNGTEVKCLYSDRTQCQYNKYHFVQWGMS